MAKRQTPWMKAYDAARLPLEIDLKELRQAIRKAGHITHKQFYLRKHLRARVQELYLLRATARTFAHEDVQRKAEEKKASPLGAPPPATMPEAQA